MPFKLGAEFSAAAQLITATVAGQLVTFLLYPVMARLYTPTAFGVFATFLTISSCMLPLATGCYEQAIINTASSEERQRLHSLIFHRLFRFAVICAVGVLSFLLLNGLYLGRDIPLLPLVLLPIGVIFQATFVTVTETLVKVAEFRPLALAKILVGSGSAISRSVLGILGSSGPLMVVGDVVAKGLITAWSLVTLRKLGYTAGIGLRLAVSEKVKLSNRYKKFPLMILPEQILNIVAGGIHVLVISIFFGAEALGYVSLVFSALYFPVTVLTSSVKDVFRSYGSAAYEQQGTCQALYIKFLLILVPVGAIIFAPLFVFSEPLVLLAFGAQWEKSAEYVKVMVPAFYSNFVAMSFAGVMIFTNRLSAALKWQAVSLVATTVSLLVGALYFKSVMTTLVLFSATRTVSYILYAALAFIFSKRYVYVE